MRVGTVSKAMRLRRRQEFLAVQGSGTKVHGKAFLAMISPSDPSVKSGTTGRVGVTVTKKVGNAVTRNRIKRLVREWLRTHGWVPRGVDVVIVAKEAAASLRGMTAMSPELERLHQRILGAVA